MPILKIQKQANCASAAVCFACSNMALVHSSPKLVVWSIQMYGYTIDRILISSVHCNPRTTSGGKVNANGQLIVYIVSPIEYVVNGMSIHLYRPNH